VAAPLAGTTLRRLTRRSEFLRAAKGRRVARPGFSLQAAGSDQLAPGVGFTVTKKTGNAPERNRIRRRLRAAVQACATGFEPQHDYVLIGRREALSLAFETLTSELSAALKRVNATPRSPRDPSR
jgi:ribonuclease P protein component